jgi:endonuclease YncB( thermonuclease family)
MTEFSKDWWASVETATTVSLALAAILLASLPAHAAEPRTCLVVGVSDGETITARCGEPGAYEQLRVRLAGIDAPEKGQPFGQRAKEAMSSLVQHEFAKQEARAKRAGLWADPGPIPPWDWRKAKRAGVQP